MYCCLVFRKVMYCCEMLLVMFFSYYSAWDRCVDLARTSEEERERPWDLCCSSEVDKEVVYSEYCHSKSSAWILIKIGDSESGVIL